MLTQAWVTKVTAARSDGPDVVGRDEADDKKNAWMLRYCARFLELGLPIDFALASYEATDQHDYDSDPADAADEEMSYMDDDGDPLI